MMRNTTSNALALVQQLGISVLFASIWVVTGFASAYASAIYYTIEVQAPNRSGHDDLVKQAERLAEAEIISRFDSDAGLTEVQIVVLGHRDGEVIPILSANVSRQQWQDSRRVDDWVQYYSSSYALLYRFEDDSDESDNQGTQLPIRSRVTISDDPVIQVEDAYEEGRLTRDEYQNLIDALD